MRNFYTNSYFEDFQENTILISGNGRSGTTILGKIIGSMKDTEYFFEPSTVWGLFSVIESLEKETWKFLFNTCLYEDLFVNALAGRNLNFNKEDDSYILNMKEQEEVSSRLARSLSKVEADTKSKLSKIAFKLPDLIPDLQLFMSYFPNIKVAIIKRSPSDTINSIIQKKWFTDESLRYQNRIWPMVKYKSNRIPPWVREEDYEYWLGLNEINKSAYYYMIMNADIKAPNIFDISYDELVADPAQEIATLTQKLQLEYGSKTDSLIAEISFPKKERISNIKSLLQEELRTKIFG